MRYVLTRPSDFAVDSLFGDLFDDWNSVSLKFPPVDVYETDDAYMMQAELPGYEEKDIDLHIDNHVLHFKSEKHTEEDKHEKYLVRERYTRPFERSFSLPENVNEEAVSARFSDGVLTITIPKDRQIEPQKLDVKIVR
ncbi:MAG: Hsp20/alpha crystallin family protein [Sphaerochaetaceae bacterium]|jgi:spore coat protein M/HSP20 family protein